MSGHQGLNESNSQSCIETLHERRSGNEVQFGEANGEIINAYVYQEEQG